MHAKADIISSFRNASDALYDYIKAQPVEYFERMHNGKWSAGQHLDHMIRSVKPLNLAFRLPSFALRIMFGNPNRPTRNYNELVERYNEKLAKGAVATGAFVPPFVKVEKKDRLLKAFLKQNEKLCKALESYGEEKLDRFLLPHPLLGKITLREMMFFTIYHNIHHLHILKERENNVSA
jgi:hypothetical protein